MTSTERTFLQKAKTQGLINFIFNDHVIKMINGNLFKIKQNYL